MRHALGLVCLSVILVASVGCGGADTSSTVLDTSTIPPPSPDSSPSEEEIEAATAKARAEEFKAGG